MTSKFIKDIFKEIDNQYKIDISHEMIDVQPNDYIVDTLTDYYQQLINEITSKSNKIKSSVELQKNSKCTNILHNIDFAIKERFGITVKHTAGLDCVYAIYVTDGKDELAISNGSNAELMDALLDEIQRKHLTEYNTRAKENVSILSPYESQIHNDKTLAQNDPFRNDNNSFVYRYYKSLLGLKKKLESDNVFVDRKKAKILGLPSDHICYAVHNLYELIKYADLNARELTAVFLHEVGHAFTHIEYTYRTVANVSVLMDTFMDNIEKKNKTPKESLILAYERATGNSAKEYKDKNAIAATIYIADSFIKENKFDISHYAEIDSEQLADQFSGKFGLGPELVSSLEKMSKGFSLWNMYKKGMFSLINNDNVFFLVLTTIFAIVLVVLTIPFVFFTIICNWLFCLIWGYGKNTDSSTMAYNTYDALSKRYSRIRNEMIRALRSGNLDKAVVANMITSIENIDRVIKRLGKVKPSHLEAIVRKLSSKAKQRLEIRTIEQLIEDLDANNLYLAAAKISNKL